MLIYIYIISYLQNTMTLIRQIQISHTERNDNREN